MKSILLALGAMAAAGADPAAEGWRTLARADADAALTLIADNHPGAVPALGDKDFQDRLKTARRVADERIPRVRDYGSYAATMLGIANAFGDGHIWTNGKLSPSTVGFAGLVSVRQAGEWKVGLDARDHPADDLTGAKILSCDGVDAERLGADRVGAFHADASSEASLAQRGYTLLLDSGNPWAPPLKRCTFRTAAGKTVEVALQWSQDSVQKVQPKLVSALHSAQAGMGISDLPGGGKWIALESLDGSAEPVVAEAERRAAQLRAAPLVVVDLRGNGGGDSRFSDRLAEALVGKARADAASWPVSGCDGAYWRASEGNLDAARRYAAERTGPSKDYFTELAADLESARKAGQAFAPALPACAAKAVASVPAPAKLPASAMKGRLVLLTDRACFSSCLIATDTFRRIGALHVGEATDRSTRYMEVREVTLPSGLRTFSTLMKVAVGLPDYGPYTPEVRYDGPLDDSEALKSWVASLPQLRR